MKKKLVYIYDYDYCTRLYGQGGCGIGLGELAGWKAKTKCWVEIEFVITGKLVEVWEIDWRIKKEKKLHLKEHVLITII